MYNLLNTALTFIKNINWTGLKISILGNILLVGLVIFLYAGNVQPEPEIIIRDRIIEIPGKDGKLDTIYYPKEIPITNPINKELLAKYNASKDTIAKLELYKDAIKEREYNEVYEDSSVKISIYTKVQGKLLKQAPNYFIKPSVIHFKDTIKIIYNKPPTNKILIGVETGLPLSLFTDKSILNPDPVVKGSIYFQNKKSNILTAGFDTNKTIWIGYLFKL